MRSLFRSLQRAACLRRLASVACASWLLVGCASQAPPAMAPPQAPAIEAAPSPAAAPAAAPASDMSRAGLSKATSQAPAPAPVNRALMGTQSAPAAPGASPSTTKPAEAKAETAAQQMLVFTGELHMLTEQNELASTLDRALDVAESFGGYIGGRTDSSVTLRVPSAHFREALTKLDKLGEVTHRSVTAEDVTEQFSDLEVRLSNLKTTQKRLQEFLAKSVSMADMLTVQRELERVSGEIEQIEGKMRFLKSRASFSTITVSVSARPRPAPVVAKIDPPPPPPPPARKVDIPVDWLSRVGIDALLNLH